MTKRLLIGLFVIFSVIRLGESQGFTRNLADIETPLPAEKLDFEPVEVFVGLKAEADPTSFEAWLNNTNISSKFISADGGVKGQLTQADGLKTFDEGERGSIYTKGLNLLMTKVKGKQQQIDLDFRLFFVETGSVKTTRDDRGVWFITGSDRVSPYYISEAMGYAVAEDRLWQMELYRRQAHGTLSEIFGADQLSTDIFVRTIQYSNQELADGFSTLSPEVQKAIKGYVAGINRRIAEIHTDSSKLPFEFKAMAARLGAPLMPADWTVGDVLAWNVWLCRIFDPEALDTAQLENAALLQNLSARFGAYGPAMFQDLRWTNDPEAQTYIAGGLSLMSAGMRAGSESDPSTTLNFEQVAEEMKERSRMLEEKLKKINAHVKMGSYAWVVSGDKTLSGNPILYAGPQMGFSVPSIVLEGSIRAGGMNISGMSVPGLPGFTMARTPHHAWSQQVGHAHTTDYYLETPSAVSLHRYETIKVAGQADVVLPVFRTVHGPVVNPMPFNPATYVPSPGNPIISWKYSHWGYEVGSMEGYLDLAKAQSMDAFGAGIEKVALSQHFCYADRDGNIAYWMSGRNPVRPPGEWRLPQGAVRPALEWNSAVLMPRSTDRNAERGFYAGWNNKTNPDYDNAYNSLSDIYGPFHRAHMLYDYFDENISDPNGKLSFEQIRDLASYIAATDSFGNGGNPWKFVADDFAEAVLNADPDTPERLAALNLLSQWDGHFIAGGSSQWAFGTNRADAWILMNQWIKRVLVLTFADELGNTQSNSLLFNVLLHGLAGTGSAIVNNYNWFQNTLNPNAPQTPASIIVTALDEVLAALGPQPWGSGQRGTISFNHPMLGSVHTMPFSSRSTYAQCVEYGSQGPVRIESMLPLGESGDIRMGAGGTQLFDPNFFSMVPVYDGFTHRPFPLFD